MMDVGRHPKIKLFSYSEVESVSGYVGQFNVRILKRARSIKEELCTGCGACLEKCPSKTLDMAYDAGMAKRRAIYRPCAQAIPNFPVIDKEHCTYYLKGKCKLCEKMCPTGAIWYDQPDEHFELEVGAIVVATGTGMWDPKRLPQYSYGLSPNIITGLQFERLSSSTGPTMGQILTAEGKKPEKVAIIHCVGSRDVNKDAHAYCSRVCCMYSLKHAHQVREKTGAQVYNFFMDMRTFGKAYEEFYGRVQEEGINFIRGRGAEVFYSPMGSFV